MSLERKKFNIYRDWFVASAPVIAAVMTLLVAANLRPYNSVSYLLTRPKLWVVAIGFALFFAWLLARYEYRHHTDETHNLPLARNAVERFVSLLGGIAFIFAGMALGLFGVFLIFAAVFWAADILV